MSLEKIDIKEVFHEKNPKAARLIPGFIYNYLKRIIHQDEINSFLRIHGDKMGLDFIEAVIEYFDLKINLINEENIPDKGRNIFVANHPLGGLDGLVFAHVIGKRFPNLQFLVNDILMNIEMLEPVFLPVNKHGKQSVEYVRKIEKTYASDEQILNFPAGLCSRKTKGEVCDLEWKKSFITKAVKHKRDVIPVHIDGENSNFFYNLANIRKNLGIKTNIEMFYLVNEMFKQQSKNLTLTFGPAISYHTFSKERNPKEWAALVKDYIYKLAEGEKKPFEETI